MPSMFLLFRRKPSIFLLAATFLARYMVATWPGTVSVVPRLVNRRRQAIQYTATLSDFYKLKLCSDEILSNRMICRDGVFMYSGGQESGPRTSFNLKLQQRSKFGCQVNVLVALMSFLSFSLMSTVHWAKIYVPHLSVGSYCIL
jgi:hypothetical protein